MTLSICDINTVVSLYSFDEVDNNDDFFFFFFLNALNQKSGHISHTAPLM